MPPSHTKLTKGHEEAIYDLRKANKTGREIREALARGVPGEPPVSVSVDRCLKVARRLLDERDELYSSDVLKRPPVDGLRILTKRLIVVAEKETRRLERAEAGGRLDANKLGRLAGAMPKLLTLLERIEAFGDDAGEGKKADSAGQGGGAVQPASTFAESLTQPTAANGAQEDGGKASPHVADRPVSVPAAAP